MYQLTKIACDVVFIQYQSYIFNLFDIHTDLNIKQLIFDKILALSYLYFVCVCLTNKNVKQQCLN